MSAMSSGFLLKNKKYSKIKIHFLLFFTSRRLSWVCIIIQCVPFLTFGNFVSGRSWLCWFINWSIYWHHARLRCSTPQITVWNMPECWFFVALIFSHIYGIANSDFTRENTGHRRPDGVICAWRPTDNMLLFLLQPENVGKA